MRPVEKTLTRRQRLLLLIALPLLAAAVCAYLLSGRFGLRCLFYELTGLYCPGCGSGRAVLALMHGDWKGAFRHHPLLIPLGLPMLVIFLHEYLRLVFPGLRLKPVFFPQRLAFACLALIVLFWILRNLPPFAFLAP